MKLNKKLYFILIFLFIIVIINGKLVITANELDQDKYDQLKIQLGTRFQQYRWRSLPLFSIRDREYYLEKELNTTGLKFKQDKI